MQLVEFEKWWTEYQDIQIPDANCERDRKIAEAAWTAAMYTAFGFTSMGEIEVELGLIE